MTQRLTTAQAIIKYLASQYVQRDGSEHRFFQGCFGIFGHGNVAGMGQALEQNSSFPLLPGTERAGDGAHRNGVCENEQSSSYAWRVLPPSVPAQQI